MERTAEVRALVEIWVAIKDAGDAEESGAAQVPQKRLLTGFSEWHRAHVMQSVQQTRWGFL